MTNPICNSRRSDKDKVLMTATDNRTLTRVVNPLRLDVVRCRAVFRARRFRGVNE